MLWRTWIEVISPAGLRLMKRTPQSSQKFLPSFSPVFTRSFMFSVAVGFSFPSWRFDETPADRAGRAAVKGEFGSRGMAAGQGKFVVEGRRPSAALPCHVSSGRNAPCRTGPTGHGAKRSTEPAARRMARAGAVHVVSGSTATLLASPETAPAACVPGRMDSCRTVNDRAWREA